jgi:Phosphotransferase system, galactitol-specific IIB component
MKFLAVCGFGVGSSMILGMSLQKATSNLGVEASVENTDLSSARGMDCDAIFTSEELKNELSANTSVPVFAVKKYMDLEEVTNVLKDYLENYKK